MAFTKVYAVFGGAVLLVSVPFCWEQLATAMNYWAGDQTPGAPFAAEDTFRNGLTACALAASGLMIPFALFAITLQRLTKARVLGAVFYVCAILSLLTVVACLLVLYNTYGGTERHLGQTALAIHSGTTFCIVSLFVLYRFLEAVKTKNSHQALFSLQLVALCLAPFFYRVAYGNWFLLLGHEFDGRWVQQVSLSFGSFLLPLLAIYVGASIYKQRELPPRNGIVCIGLVLAIIAVGLMGYGASSIQPSLI